MRALVVGHGVMGKAHARTLRRLGLAVETVDPDPNAGADWLEVSPLPDADIACIATPPAVLASTAIEAMRAGMDVLIEKPMAIDTDQARSIIRAEIETGRHARVGYTERWNPAVSVLREALPLIGTLRHITVQRLGRQPRSAGLGPALDLMSHDIAVLRRLDLWPRFLHATVDGAHTSATFALTSGTATLQASHIHPTKQRTLTAVGDDGMLSLDYQRQLLVLHDANGAREIDVSRLEPLVAQWCGFIDGVGMKTSDALATLDLALRVQRGGSSSIRPSTCTAQ